MNKKLLTLLTAAMCFMTVSAEDFTVDGIKYTGDETTKTATVTGTEEGFSQTDVVIPEEVNGYTVTKIGNEAFYDNNDLISIVLPNTVKSIGNDVFFFDSNLERVVMPEQLESIGASAFYDCKSLKDISIPSSVQSIGMSAFSDCKSIESICVPEGVETLGQGVFGNCSALKSVTLPSTLKTLGQGVFGNCSALKSIELPNSLQTIGWMSFVGSGLESIHIPASVTLIETDAYKNWWPFRACHHLKTLTIAADNPVYDSRNNCNAIIETATNTLLEGCLGTVIPDDVVIGTFAFYSCQMPSIDIPSSIRVIEPYAFGGCTQLESISLPDHLTELQDGVFYQCEKLKNVKLPQNLQTIGRSAFEECDALRSITFPATLRSIGKDAFASIMGGHLTSVVIPASVEEISEGAFSDQPHITSMTVDEGNTVYDSRENCNAIIKTENNQLCFGCQTSVIPGSVTSIGASAFSGCTSLSSITIPDGVTSIGKIAFAGTGLTSIVIPASVSSIEYGAFSAKQLNTFVSLITEPFAVGTDVFGFSISDENGKTLFVPKGLTNKYKATEGWNWFETILEIGDTNDGYLWTGDYEKGGHAEATDGVSVGYANAGYTTIRLNGKPNQYTDYIQLTLNEPIKAGDVISITAYRNKNAADKKSGVKMTLWAQGGEGRNVSLASSTGLEFVNIDQSDASAGDSNRGTTPNTSQFTVPASADKYDYIMMTRSHADTNLFITKIEINGNAASGIVQTLVDMNTDDAFYNLKGSRLQQKPTQPGIYIRGGRKVIVK